MDRCNDCWKYQKNSTPMIVRGYSYLAGREYYSGPEICEQCAIERREKAIAETEANNYENKKPRS